MDTRYPRCAGIDVHTHNVVVCVRCGDHPGKVAEEVRTSSTMTADLWALSDWLAERGVTQVAMGSTGVYRKPASNILEGRVAVILVNAEHIKKVPGRKTDVKDCEWIAQLLQHGLLKAVLPLDTRLARGQDRQSQRRGNVNGARRPVSAHDRSGVPNFGSREGTGTVIG